MSQMTAMVNLTMKWMLKGEGRGNSHPTLRQLIWATGRSVTAQVKLGVSSVLMKPYLGVPRATTTEGNIDWDLSSVELEIALQMILIQMRPRLQRLHRLMWLMTGKTMRIEG